MFDDLLKDALVFQRGEEMLGTQSAVRISARLYAIRLGRNVVTLPPSRRKVCERTLYLQSGDGLDTVVPPAIRTRRYETSSFLSRLGNKLCFRRLGNFVCKPHVYLTRPGAPSPSLCHILFRAPEPRCSLTRRV